MKEHTWTSKFRPNFIVNCSMKVRGNGFGSPSPEHRSEHFFAGIKITQENNYVVNEKSPLTIPVRLTIPVACYWNKRSKPFLQQLAKDECVINLLAGIPNYQTRPSQCNNEITDSGLVFENQLCGIAFSYDNWNETQHLQLYGAVDNKINIKDRIVFLRLYNPLISQANASLFMWRNIVLPDVKVTIRDSEQETDPKGCWSRNDPHMYNFDSKTNWELQQDIGGGEYIMYKHRKLPLQINAYFRKCNGAALCNCGLAVRSGDSVFVANFCETEVEKNGIRTRKLNRYVIQRLCDDRSLVVTEDGNKIEVTIPTGTKVQFSHGKVYDFYGINGIHIYPSMLDYDITDGLCGTYNGNTADDFMEYKGLAPTLSKSDFAKSWKIQSGNNNGNPALSDYSLFDPTGKLRPAEYFAESYCTCRVNDTTFPYELPEYNCDLETPMEICRRRKSTKSVITANCATTVLRTKRSIGNHFTKRSVEEDLEEDEQPQAYAMVPDSEESNVTVEWRNGWTEESAREFCTQNIQNSPAFLPCSEFVPSSSPDTIIENCILDIKLQGDSGWIGATLQNFADSCLSQAVRMENLTETNSTTSNGQEKSIFNIIAESTCPGNCSERGICVNGICNCTTGHYGVACAQDKSDPPSIEPDAFEGSCDPKKKPCKKFIIPGTQFIDESLTCRFSQFSIISNDTTTILVTGDSFTYPGTYVSDFFMYCELPPSRRKRSVDSNDYLNGYNISVSNNGVDFTEELTTIIYDQECYDCNLTSSISCVQLETCPTKTKEPSEESKLSIWIIVLIVLGSLILLISIGLFCFRKHLRCGKRDPYVSDSTASLPNTFMHAQSKPPTAHNDIFLATHLPDEK
ncbi:von Willebrand factor D and EGF domain-containing protein-like isoform X1 [Mytilus galloprovincialis]|uniref:von Willebrand factor D and EGF domain-containing protein-like isoform X1 n=2 Tax=Mytilus galloprovincialis TaxID=29158 RepID=UPI003F7C4898